jgi:hypothetical protein
MTASHTDETDAFTTNTSSHGYVDFDAVSAQARKLAYVYPQAAHEPRARLGATRRQVGAADAG